MRLPTRHRLRHVQLLIPLTWPGFLYGLWQRRRGLWWSKPRARVGQWRQQAQTHPAVGRLVALGVGLGAVWGVSTIVVAVGPWIAELLAPPMLTPAGGGEVISGTDVLSELAMMVTSVYGHRSSSSARSSGCLSASELASYT